VEFESGPKRGAFLGWGIDWTDGREGVSTHCTVAIVEWVDGTVDLAHPNRLRFLTPTAVPEPEPEPKPTPAKTDPVWTKDLPTVPGLYRHHWSAAHTGERQEQLLYVGYVDASMPKLQGTRPSMGVSVLRCCPQDECLHADRLTPKQWGGWWSKVEGDTP